MVKGLDPNLPGGQVYVSQPRVQVASPYGDPRGQASRMGPWRDDVPYQPGPPPTTGWYSNEWTDGRSPREKEELRARFDAFTPRLVSGGGGKDFYGARQFFQGLLPAGADLSPAAGAGFAQARQASAPPGMGGGGGNVMFQTMMPYQPETASQDRQNFPVHRQLSSIYWRLFYKMDDIAPIAIDYLSELPWGAMELSGEGVDGEIKDGYETAWTQCNIDALLPYFVKEFYVMGEVAPHCFYDSNQRLWSHVALHNPDNLEVLYSPLIKMDPIVRFRPDDRLTTVLNSASPMLSAIRESIPTQLLQAITSGHPIELSPLNLTFIARKQHPYDVRGTSIFTRLWRLFMLEDAIYNASLSVARRAASPIRIAKIGDAASGWIPNKGQEEELLSLLQQADYDPAAWIVYHSGLNIDVVGMQERAWKIEQSSDFIERRKLMALGISKGLLYGEVTYAAASSGLAVLLQRLRGTRDFFQNTWIIPKFFKPLAYTNQWIKPTQAELDHGVRTRRSHSELLEDHRYALPTIQWARQLDPSVESAQLQAVEALRGMGVVFSKQYLTSLVGQDWEEHLKQREAEVAIEKETVKRCPEMGPELAGGGQGGDAGGMLPGIPPGDLGFEDGGGGDMGGGVGDMGAPPMSGPPGVEGDATSDEGGPGGRRWLNPGQWQGGRCGNWEVGVVGDLLDTLRGGQPQEELWRGLFSHSQMLPTLIREGDWSEVWEVVEDYLFDEGYPPSDVATLQGILKSENVFRP